MRALFAYKPPGTVRAEGAPLGAADKWVVAMGVLTTPYAGGTCEKLKAVPPGGGDAGPGDVGVADASGDATPAADSAIPSVDSGTTSSDSAPTATDTGTGAAPSGTPKSDSGGCRMSAGLGALGPSELVVALSGVLLAVSRRRRRMIA